MRSQKQTYFAELSAFTARSFVKQQIRELQTHCRKLAEWSVSHDFGVDPRLALILDH